MLIQPPKASIMRRLRGSLVRMLRFRLSRWKPFGLRLGRIREWLAVLRDNESRPGFRGWIEMLRLTFRRRNVSAISDYRKCVRCPLHDRALKRCGDGGGVIGCGCFTVYAIAAGKACWGRENVPGFAPLGYD